MQNILNYFVESLKFGVNIRKFNVADNTAYVWPPPDKFHINQP